MTEPLNQQLAEKTFFTILNSNPNLIKCISEGYLNDLEEIYFYQNLRGYCFLKFVISSDVKKSHFCKINLNTYLEIKIVKTSAVLLQARYTKINIDFVSKAKELINFI